MSNIQFKIESFWSLLSNSKIEKVTIPIIQRAYTQGGRGDDAKIAAKGARFLKRLIEALTDKNKPITLDFVYGSNVKNKVYPLDGQQRLTTLFLLHWYIAQKEDKLSDEVKNTLKKFTYETRQSSRYFCEHLCKYKVAQRMDKLSSTIKNQKWFMLSWEDDPSICSILGMLDKIDISLKDCTETFWDKLSNSNETECPISFFYTSLEKLNLTDDLYVKMNARGLELTDFEKFKAPFNRKIDDEGWDKDKAMTDKFAHKIDTDWTDLFWKYKGDDGKIDNELMNFFAGTAINYYAQSLEIADNKEETEKTRKELKEKGKPKTVTDDAVKRDRIGKRITHLYNNPNEVNSDDFSTETAFNHLVNCLNKYAENSYAELKTDIVLWKYCKDTLFKDIVQNETTEWQNRIVFYAQTEYLLNATFDKSTFNNWMRVVRNIVENSTIDSAMSFIGAIGLINELSKGSADIYEYLSKEGIQSDFAKEQVKEEIEKAKIIIAKPEAKQVIHNTEDTNFCRGKIDFALYCTDYDIDNNPNPQIFDSGKLNAIFKVIKEHLAGNDVSNDFRRVFFTIQNNDFYDYWKGSMWSWQFHRRCLLESTNDFKNHYALRGKKNENISNNNWMYSKELLNKLAITSMDKIIDDYKNSQNFSGVPLWIQAIIDNPSLLECSNKHYMVYTNAGKYYLVEGCRTAVQKDNWGGLREII